MRLLGKLHITSVVTYLKKLLTILQKKTTVFKMRLRIRTRIKSYRIHAPHWCSLPSCLKLRLQMTPSCLELNSVQPPFYGHPRLQAVPKTAESLIKSMPKIDPTKQVK